MKILVAIPTYNNEFTIYHVIQEALKICPDVLIINDGSTDKTSDELKKNSGTNIIAIPKNRGKGNALREAFKWGIENAFTHLITIDADGQHNPKEIPIFINHITKDENTLLIGSRDFSSVKVPFLSRIGRKCSNIAFYLATGILLNDTQSGFRVYPLNKILNLTSKKNKYDFEIELLLKAALSGIEIKEIKVSVHYSKKTRKTSSFKPILDSVRIARILIPGILLRKI